MIKQRPLGAQKRTLTEDDLIAHEHPESTVSHTFSLSDTRQAYEAFDADKTGKVVILL
jgi:threonine dehydrogenase-like Zn-dependent dehydrogenase